MSEVNETTGAVSEFVRAERDAVPTMNSEVTDSIIPTSMLVCSTLASGEMSSDVVKWVDSDSGECEPVVRRRVVRVA